MVTVRAGASGNNSISAAGDTAASKGKALIYYTGSGTDSFTGEFENDTVYVSTTALVGDTLTGGSGTNTLALSNAGSVSLGGVKKVRHHRTRRRQQHGDGDRYDFVGRRRDGG